MIALLEKHPLTAIAALRHVMANAGKGEAKEGSRASILDGLNLAALHVSP